MSKRALAYDMRAVKVDGQDVEEVYDKAREALEHVRSGAGPVFLDVETYRMHGHYIGDPQVYRSKDDREEAAEHDPIALLREQLDVSGDDWAALEQEVGEIVEASVEFAKNGPIRSRGRTRASMLSHREVA
jgi:TPP-dependent pyruvate/acetoin dehydrogenase alpha subunit